MIVRLQDNPHIIVKPETYPITVTGNTYYNFIASGETVITQVQTGNLVDVTIYNPSGSSTTWGMIVGDITNQTDLYTILTGMTADILANAQCCTGNTAAIDYHYSQFTGLTQYISTLIVPAITGNTQNILDLENAFDTYTGTTAPAQFAAKIHTHPYSGLTGLPDLNAYALSGHTHSYNDLQNLPTLFSGDYDDLTNKPDLSVYQPVSGMSIYLTGVTWNDVTNKPDLSVYQPVSGMSVYLTGVTWNDVTNKPDLTLQSDFTGHTGDTTFHTTMAQVNAAISAATSGLTSSWSGLTGLPMDNTDLAVILTGITADTHTNALCCTGNTADIQYLSGQTDYHYSQFTGFTDYFSTLVLPAITGNTQDILDLENAFDNHTGNTTIHFSGHTFTQSGITVITQVGDNINIFVPPDAVTGVTWGGVTNKPAWLTGTTLNDFENGHNHSQYLTGFTVTCDMVTGCTDTLYVHNDTFANYTGQTNNELTGITSSINSHTGDTSIHWHMNDLTGFTSNATFTGYTASTYNTLTGLTDSGIILQGIVNDLEAAFTGHTGDTTIHYVQSAITITESQISDLQDYALESDLTGHTSDLTIHYQQSAITITESQVTNLVSDLAGKSDTGHTHAYSVITNTPDLSVYQPVSGMSAYTLTGTTQALSGAFDSHTGNTDIHFEKTDISYNDLQDLPTLFSGDYDDLTNKPDLSIYLTGYTVTADDVTGITASLYAPIIHTHPYSGLTGLPTLFSGDYDDLTNKPDLSVYQPVSGMSVYLTGVTWNDVTNKPDLTLQSDFTGHTSDLTIHYPQSGISITESQISDFGDYALESDFTGHTSDLTIHFVQSGISITESQISDLQAYTLTGTTQALSDAFDTYTGTTAPASFLPITGLTGYWTSAQTENYVTGLGYITGYTVTADDVTGITASLYSLIGHTHPYSAITDTPDLNAYALSGHTHAQYLTGITCSDVTGCTDGLYAPIVHTHEYSGLTGLPDLNAYALSGHTHPQYLTGYTVTADDVTGITASLYAPIVHTHAYSAITDTPDLSVYQPVSGMSAYLTGVTWNDVTNKPDLTLQSDFTGHTSDLTIHYPQSGISITESQISDLQAYALQSAINIYTGTTAPATYATIANAITGITGMGTGSTLVHGTPVANNKVQIKSITATNLTLNDNTNDVNIEAGSIAPKDFWTGTEAEYLALGSYDSNTLYFCTA